ncbi:DUF4957 domain-containing protein [Pedobacter sp. ok626]|uniref:DUF4957 domain-containing protein n=1 Tax=Pedobacter sp. ok626 TaxID=1761882 RepID=UPI0014050840|nr:DUF5123 domain-containing protein [Pedobacter sp. ok626]
MKNIFKNYMMIALLIAMVSSIMSCKKEDDLGEAPRLFRPVIKGDLTAPSNYIDASWQQMSGVKGYIAQISRDTFKTIDRSVNIDSNKVTFEGLLWEQLYQIQVIAVATDSSKNSKPSFLGEIKTPRFPTIVVDAQLADVGSKSILFKWRNEGEAVTTVKVVSVINNAIVQTISLTATDISNAYLLVAALSPETAYKIELYSGAKFRGSNSYTTKAIPSGVIIDLTAIADKPTILADTILKVPASATIVLRRGMEYSMTSINLNKSVTIISGENQLVPAQAVIFFNTGSNFAFAANASIDNITFNDVIIRTNDAAGKYAFNPNSAGNIGAITFESCRIENMRGVARLRGALTINSLTFNNCLIDSIGGYGILTVDDAASKAKNITISNSTVSRAEVLLVSKSAAESVKINNSTFYRSPLGAKFMVDYNNVVLGTLDFTNNIFGPGKATAATPPVSAVNSFRAASVGITGSNNFTTSDFVWSASALQIPGTTAYTKTATDIFTSPATRNFTIKDGGFGGRSTAGDPRWRLK